MKYRGIFEYEYPTEHKTPVSIDVHLHGDCVKGKIIEWEYRPLEQEPTTKNDLRVDWESYKDVDGNSLDDLILEVLQNNFDCGNTYGYKVADEIIGLLPSVTPQEPILDEIRAEIAEYGSIMVAYAITKDTKTDKGIEKLVSDVLKQAKKQVLAMIDKYKAESEEEK